MIKTLYYSGLVSTTMSAALLVLLVAIVALTTKSTGSDSNRIARAVSRMLGSWAFVGFLALGTLVNTGYGIYKGYVVPRDYMQDVMSAEEFLAGRSLYPDNMTSMFIDRMANFPPKFSLWPEGSARREEEVHARSEAASSPWVQAHPPLMTLFFAPLVKTLGTYGTFLAISVLSVASLLIAPVVIARTLGVGLPKLVLASLGLAILGWAASIEDLRDGQSGPYLTLLCVLGWAALRTGRPVMAGVAVGLATCLKLYPGIILLYFLVKDRWAFVAGAVTVAAGLGLSGVLCGPQVFLEYIKTARFVSDYYSTYSSNISLLSSLMRFTGVVERQSAARAAWLAFASISVLGAIVATRLSRFNESDRQRSIDLGYSFFLSLGILLTPIAWDHYTVMLLLPLAVLAYRELGPEASPGSTIAFLVLIAIMATPFGTFAFARTSLSGRIDDYFLKITLLNIRTASVLFLAGWLAWRHAVESGIADHLAVGRTGIGSAEVEQS